MLVLAYWFLILAPRTFVTMIQCSPPSQPNRSNTFTEVYQVWHYRQSVSKFVSIFVWISVKVLYLNFTRPWALTHGHGSVFLTSRYLMSMGKDVICFSISVFWPFWLDRTAGPAQKGKCLWLSECTNWVITAQKLCKCHHIHSVDSESVVLWVSINSACNLSTNQDHSSGMTYSSNRGW